MPDTTVFLNARVLDTVAGRLTEPLSVIVAGDTIRELTEADRGDTISGRVFDLQGRTLMPGLCDAHVHVTAFTADFRALGASSPYYVAARTGEVLEGMLLRGFTTVRDAGGADFGIARAVDERRMRGPSVLYCGHALSQTGGHGDMRGPGDVGLYQCFCCAGLGRICDGVSEVLRAAREEIRRGATHLKLMASGGVASPTDRIGSTQFSEAELRAIVDEADAAQIPVLAHAYTARAANRALRCGVRSIEHGNLIDEETIALLLERDAWLVPTLVTYRALIEEGEAAGMPGELVAKTDEVLEAGMTALSLAYRAKVNIAFGTDLLGTMHRRQLEEFTIRASVVSPADLIRQATINAATLFGRAQRIGRIAAGLDADLIVVDGDPLTDIGVLTDPERNLKLVMKRGRIEVDRLRP